MKNFNRYPQSRKIQGNFTFNLKKFKKISPISLKIPSPKETGKTFILNAKLKANYFSKFVNYPVISDDSGLCIKSLNNKPGIYSARLAKKSGGFRKL